MIFFTNLKNFIRDHILKHITPRVGLLIVVVLCVVSLAIQYFRRPDAISPLMIAGAVVVPFQEGVNSIGKFLYQSETDRLDLKSARERIAALELENENLRRKITDMESIETENLDLRKLLSAKERLQDYEVTEAQIIGYSGTNSMVRYTVNKGTIDGIKVNMNVVNGDGLVGLVTKVGLNYAIITAIIEDGFSVSAMTKNTHENLVVAGNMTVDNHGKLVIESALSTIDFKKNSVLVTSNISDKYLPNLLIGYVEEEKTSEDGLRKNGSVKTAVDFTAVNEVLIVTTMKEELREAE